MAVHDVTFTLPKRKLDRSDAKFHIKCDGETFGTMTVSNGSVVWFPKGVSYGYRIGWKKFDELMQGESQTSRKTMIADGSESSP